MSAEYSTNRKTEPNTPHFSRLQIVFLSIGIILIASNLRPSITSVSPLIGEIMANTGLSNTWAGLLTSLPLFSFAIFSMLAPRIARRFGMEFTLFASMVILTAGILIRFLPSMATLFLGTTLLGVAIAIGNVLIPGLIKRDFPHKIGLMTGFYSMFMNLFAGLASGLSVPLSKGLGLGWRGALLCWALFSFIAIVVWLPQMRSRRPFTPPARSSGGTLWHSGLAWQVTVFFGLMSMIFYATVTWIPELLQDRGISVSTAGWMLAIMQFGGLPASFLVPPLAARLSNQKRLVAGAALLMIIGYIGLITGGNALLALWILFIGVGQGAAFSLALTFLSLRASNPHQTAELSGMTQSIGYLLGATAPILFGFLHDLTHAWTLSLLFMIACCVIQLFMGLGAGRNAYVTSKQTEGSWSSAIVKRRDIFKS